MHIFFFLKKLVKNHAKYHFKNMIRFSGTFLKRHDWFLIHQHSYEETKIADDTLHANACFGIFCFCLFFSNIDLKIENAQVNFKKCINVLKNALKFQKCIKIEKYNNCVHLFINKKFIAYHVNEHLVLNAS